MTGALDRCVRFVPSDSDFRRLAHSLGTQLS